MPPRCRCGRTWGEGAIVDTYSGDEGMLRRRWCRCGARWTTLEVKIEYDRDTWFDRLLALPGWFTAKSAADSLRVSSKHTQKLLKRLHDEGVLHRRKEGAGYVYSVKSPPITAETSTVEST